jgi:HD-GYP domain-containing protein (c-di-GMP phosphodiesterase class II)
MADAWDAMTSARPYRDAGSADDAFAECLRERGAQFAPRAVDALARSAPTGRSTRRRPPGRRRPRP